jgi:hypothetical protein
MPSLPSPDINQPREKNRTAVILNRTLVVVVIFELFFMPIAAGIAAAATIRNIGESVTNAISDFFGLNSGSTLSGCATIPADWRPHIDEAGNQSGASPALIAAIVSGGEHYSWYQTKKWPAYQDKYDYGTPENPTIHNHSDREGYVRGPSQFIENTFQAYSPHAKQNGQPSRFGGGFKVEPYIEETQPSLTATGAYLKASGARVGASDNQIMDAILAYNHADWYVKRVFGIYQEYLSCSQSVAASSGSGGVPLLKQGDPRWGSVSYGCNNGSTIRSSGCGLTAAAMVLQFNGINITPDQLVSESINNGHRDCRAGTAHSFFPYIAKKYGLKSESELSWNTAMNHLKAGRPVIVSGKGPAPFTPNGHYVVLTKYNDNGTIAVNDPAGGLERDTSYPENHIQQYNTSFRGVIYR